MKEDTLRWWNITGQGIEGRRDAETGSLRYYLKDHLGSTRAVVDNSGTVLETFDYYPGGLYMPQHTSTTGNTIEKFTGKERDESIGLDYFGARYYDAALGRWHGVDPLVDEYPSWNPYNYTLNNPVNLIDPTGLCPEDGSAGENQFGPGECMKAAVVTAQRPSSGSTLSFATVALVAVRIGGQTLVRTPNPYAIGAGVILLGGAIVADHFIDLNPNFDSMELSVGKSIDWNNAPSSPQELSEEWNEVPSMAPNRREFVNEKTSEEVSFDKGQEGKSGWAGRDHWHRKNPNSTSERDMNLDKDGNPVPRGHKRSHIPAGGK